MGKIPNPFSLYDFLGYFFPGALLVYASALSIGHIHPQLTAIDMYRNALDFDDLGLVLPFVLLSYVAGHLVSYLSSVTVERYATLQYDQPSRFLLNIRIDHSYFFEQLRKGKFDMWRILLGVFMLPVAIFDLMLGQLLGLSRVYARGLDKLLVPALRKRAYERLVKIIGFDPKKEEHGQPAETDFFLFLQHFALENCERHGPKIDNYVALYGFLRSLTLIAVLLCWVSTYHVFVIGNAQYLPFGTPLVVGAGAFLCFMAYMKFWRRYSLEILMAVAVYEDS